MRAWATLLLITLLGTFGAPPARAAFDAAVIDELMTSYAGDPSIQFVEIRMLAVGQNIVVNSVLAAFNATGSYVGDVLVVPAIVPLSGTDVRWLMATSAFTTATGLQPDFVMPAGLPTGGGMICWGAPGIVPPAPADWDHTNLANYVDCVAYGTYAGPCNVHVCGFLSAGSPTPLNADGHSLVRIGETQDNAADFACADPASPTTNTPASVPLAATTSCSGADTDADGTADDEDNCPTVPNADQSDVDLDGAGDACDNCALDPNPPGPAPDGRRTTGGQLDDDLDGTGNLCDADFDQSGFVNVIDLLRFLDAFGKNVTHSTCPDPLGNLTGSCARYDLTAEGPVINVSDLLVAISPEIFGVSVEAQGCALADDSLVHCPLECAAGTGAAPCP